MNTSSYNTELLEQTNKIKATVALTKIVHDLYYDRSVELVFFRNPLISINSSQILDLHHYATQSLKKPVSIFESLEMAKALFDYQEAPSKLDLGKLTYNYHLERSEKGTLTFLKETLDTQQNTEAIAPRDVVLYGFGRIGRLVARILMAHIGGGTQLRLRAIVTRDVMSATLLEKRAALLRYDSIHGSFMGSVLADIEQEALIINGTTVKMITAKSPESIDYTIYGIHKALVIDNTGVYRDRASLETHFLAQGVDKVMITAPANGIPNIVYGVNHLEYDVTKNTMFSAASCTTNAITPILKVMDATFGIQHGHVETIHAYTNDQNLVDNFHSKYRRGRAAALNG